jgi:hypothetical protein
MRRPQLRSTFARAVVPVAAGLGFFAILGLLLWGVAAVIANNGDQTSQRLAPTVQEMGSRARLAPTIDRQGPIVLQDLIGSDTHVVLEHETGQDVDNGWVLYLAHPADRTATCNIEVVKNTHTFTDCEGRTLRPDQLASVPKGMGPIINADGTLTLDLTPNP